MINQHYLKAIGQSDHSKVDVPKIISNSNQISGHASVQSGPSIAGQKIATLDQLRPLLDKQNHSTSSNGMAQTQASSGASTSYHSHNATQSSNLSHTQRLGAVQQANNRTTSVGSHGQKMV